MALTQYVHLIQTSARFDYPFFEFGSINEYMNRYIKYHFTHSAAGDWDLMIEVQKLQSLP